MVLTLPHAEVAALKSKDKGVIDGKKTVIYLPRV